MGVIKELVQRADSWVNAMTGLGTLRDKLMHTQVVAGSKISDPTLEALFNDDDIARRVVAKLPREATRRGFRLELEADPEEEETADVSRLMEDEFTRLDAMPKLRDGWIWARLYGGGSGVFVGADDGRSVDQPLNEAGIRSIKFLNEVKRPQLQIVSRYEDIQAPEYGQPELYRITQAASGQLLPREGVDVHASRLILFSGALTARMTMVSPTGFEDSVLQNAMAPLQQTAAAWQSVAHLLTDASQGVLKIANLVDLVATGGQEVLRSRIQLMDLARSVCRSILIDAEKESFERIATSFAGLPEVMDKLMMRMCAAAEQPVTLLYGRSAAGMNATGENDVRGWYDTVAEGQTDELKPRLMRLIKLLFLAKDGPTKGVVPEQWCIEFNPLWQPTDKELADVKKVKADTYVALVTAQIMTDAEAGIGLAPDFPTIDVESRETLAEADKEEGLRPREVNTPEPPPDPNAPPGSEGGADGGGERGDSSQPRVPAGSSKGGQWASSGGAAGGATKKVSAKKDVLTDEQRQAIRQSFKTGKNAAVIALQQKLVAKYGVPLGKAAIMYEKDIKAQKLAAKGKKTTKPTTVVTQPTAAPSKPLSYAASMAKEAKAHSKKLKATPADLAAAKAKTAAMGKKLAEKQASIESIKKQHAEINKAAKAAKSKTFTKAEAVADMKKAEVAALKHAVEQGFHNIPHSSLVTISKYGSNDPKDKPAALAMIKAKAAGTAPGHTLPANAPEKQAAKSKSFTEKWGIGKSKGFDDPSVVEKTAKKSSGADWKKDKPKPPGAGPEHLEFTGGKTLEGHLIKGGTAEHTSKHVTPAGLAASVQGPLKVAPSPFRAEMEKAVKEHATSFKVVEQAVDKHTAEQAYKWKAAWVSTSTDGLAESALAGLNDRKSHINAQYHATQALLKHHLPELQKRGIVDKDGYVRLYRGVKVKQGDKLAAAWETSPDGSATLGVRGTSSWTASHGVARSFAGGTGQVVQQRVHISNALVVHNFESKWHLKEAEWALITPTQQHRVVKADESVPDLYF